MSGEELVAETRATYDRITADYEARSATPHPGLDAARASFGRAVLAGGVVADVGCGPGHDAEHFASLGLPVVAMDGSPGMLDLVRRRGLVGLRGDLRQLPFRDAALGGLWASACLLHVPREDVPATLAGWRRVLRPGAALGLSTALGEDDGWEDVPYTAHLASGGAPLRRWFVRHRRDDLLGLLGAAGFAVLAVSERTTHRHWLQVLARAA